MPQLWPFRKGNDELYQSNLQTETIYDALGSLPERNYSAEIQKYNQWRWRRGMIQSLLPTAAMGTLIGMAFGVRNCRVEGRYVGRLKVFLRYSGAGASVGTLSGSMHHFMVVRNNYEEKFFYPMVAGASGGAVIVTLSQSGTIAVGMFTGAMIGSVYSASCWASTWYQRRRLDNFLESQRQMQVPVHKVTPELQPMYRAYLFDHRPIEEESEGRRKAILVARTGDDTRLDADAFLNNYLPEVFDWVNFPDWWPLKYPIQTDEQSVLMQRQRDEEILRRKDALMSIDNGVAFKRHLRGSAHRER